MAADNLRVVLAADPDLGAGNVLAKLMEHRAPTDRPALTFDTELDGRPAWTPFTLGELTDLVRARAGWLRRHGVRARDPVAVYVTASADCLLSFLALNWLGAIPALMNGNMPGDIAVEFIRRLRARFVLTDGPHRARLGHADLAASLLPDVSAAGTGDPAGAPAPYRYHADDPIAITHSSGTTRMPAAVAHSHGSLFAATRAVRLGGLKVPDGERILSALPAAHTAGILTVHQALCNGTPLLFLSGQGGPFARSAEVIVDAIERWRPTHVYGFAVTWAELARFDLTQRDISSVRIWSNSGDTAHEAHIRRLVAVGSHQVYSKEGVVTLPGSRFNDTLGSTEMGYGGFQISHRPGTERYNRCVGKPVSFAEIILVDVKTGDEVPIGEVGQVAMKSPTLALGYWNDSVTTYRTRLNGYYLTGDLMYRDKDGYFYHLDRASDATDLGDGNWFYSVLSEERILKHCPDVRDCTVLAARGDGKLFIEVLLMLAPKADPALDREGEIRQALGQAAAALPLRIVAVPDDGVVVGPTGKVRKFLMRQRLLASTGAGSTPEGSS